MQAQDLAAALDNPPLVYTASGGNWSVYSGSSVYGDSAVFSAFTGSTPVDLSTTVSGPAYLVFWAKKNGGYAATELLQDGASVLSLDPRQGNGWTQYSVFVPAGPHSFVWRVASGGNIQGLDYVRVVNSPVTTLSEVLPGFPWSTGGSASWTGSLFPATHYRGRALVKLGWDATASQAAWLEAPFTGPARLTWRAGSGTRVLVDGFPQSNQSGAGIGYCVLPPGSHTVRWQLERTAGAGSSAQDYEAWVEDVALQPGTAVPLDEILNQPAIPGMTPLSFTTGGTAPFDAVYLPASGNFTAGYQKLAGILPPGGVSWLETTVTGPGNLSTSGHSSIPGFDLTIQLDGVTKASSWSNLNSLLIGPGTHTVRWQVQRGAGSTYISGDSVVRAGLSSINWSHAAQVSFAEALDVPDGVEFSTTAPEITYGRTTNASVDGDAVYFNSGSDLSCTLTGPGRFAWTGTGRVGCYLDGLNVRSSGTSFQASSVVLSSPGSIDIPPGSHTLRWVVPNGYTAQIDNLTYTPAAALTPFSAPGEGISWQYSPEVSAWNLDGGITSLFLPALATGSRLYGMSASLNGPGIVTIQYQQRHVGTAAVFSLDNSASTTGAELNDGWRVISIPVPSGAHTLTISAAPGATFQTVMPGYFLFREITWQQQQTVSIPEALDAPNLAWTTSGTAAWEGVATPGGGDMARLTGLAANGLAIVGTTVTGPGLLTFRGAKSSIYGFRFLINGVGRTYNSPDGSFCGELPAGTSTLSWEASLPSGTTPWSNAEARLDSVQWSAYAPQPLSAWASAAGFTFTASSHQWSTVASPDADGGGSLHPLGVVNGTEAWLETTVTGPAALEFSLFHTSTGSHASSVAVSIDGGVRTLETVDSLDEGWSDHRLYIPFGSHTVRWTLSASGPLVFLDRLRLLPASLDLSTGSDLAASAWLPGNGSKWFTLIDASLPDGDMLTCESGFWFGLDSPSITLPVEGPARLSLHTKDFGGFTSSPFTATATPESGDWTLRVFDIPPGRYGLKLSDSNGNGAAIDRVSVETVPPVPLSDLFPLSGAVWATSAENPSEGYTGAGNGNSIYASASGQEPPAWVEVTLDGPGQLRFSASSVLPLFAIAPEPVVLSVNGTALPGLSTGHDKLLPGYDISDMIVHLPEGQQTVRWTVSPGVDGVAATLRLYGLSFTSSPALLPPSAGAQRAFVSRTSVAVQTVSGSANPVLRISCTGNSAAIFDKAACLAWSNTQPGKLRFRWRRPPGVTWSQPFEPAFRLRQVANLPPPASEWIEGMEPGFIWSPLTDGTWKTVEVLLPRAGAECTWRLVPDNSEVEVTDLEFIPAENVPLGDALGIPGAIVTTDPQYPWTGMRFPDGKTCILPFFQFHPYWNAGWLDVTVAGPAEIRWQNHKENQVSLTDNLEIFLDGSYASLWRGLLPGGIRAKEHYTIVPPGLHTLRWKQPNYRQDYQDALLGMNRVPLPAAWFDWNPWNHSLPLRAWPETALDDDQDGMDNLMEFAFGTSITAPDPPIQPVTSIEASHLCVTLPVPRPLSDGVRVLIETSGDLLTWQSAAVEQVGSAPPGRVKYRLTDTLPAGAGRVYVRARVEIVPE